MRLKIVAKGDEVLKARLEIGLSQTEMAMVLGIGQRYLAGIESGSHPVSIRLGSRMRKLFGKRFYEIFDFEGRR